MIITPEEAARLLNNSGNLLRDEEDSEAILINEFVEQLVEPLRPVLYTPPGTNRKIPPIFREIIALQTNLGAGVTNTANAYGISVRHTTELKGGNVHRSNQREKDGLRDSDIALAQALEKSLGKVRDKALEKIYASMDNIQEDALINEPPKVLSTIAANLSRVVSSTMRNDKNTTPINVQTVFFAPNKSKLEEYDVIDIG